MSIDDRIQQPPTSGHSIILVDPDDHSRLALVERLRTQGYAPTGFAGPVEGAHAALSSPPSAVIADLWMTGVSGVQLARLLRAEPATERVPVILRGPDTPRNQFWAERAGAADYVVKGRTSDLMRSLARLVTGQPAEGAFFSDLQGAESVIRERIAALLDAALFESVIASEVRTLSTCGSFQRVFDQLTQFVSRVMSYRWLGLALEAPAHVALHSHPVTRAESEQEARSALGLAPEQTLVRIEDENSSSEPESLPPLVREIRFGGEKIARLALSQRGPDDAEDPRVLDVIARELGGPLRMCSLVEEAQRAATTDPLTGLMNRRAFLTALGEERQRVQRHGYALSLLLLDVDKFKNVNDQWGHATGDQVLSSLGRLLVEKTRKVDIVGRWGGEEFVIALSGADERGAVIAAERIREAVQRMSFCAEGCEIVPTTISIGVTRVANSDSPEALIDRADRAMYQAKSLGRNRVYVAPEAIEPSRTGELLAIPLRKP